MDASGSVMPWPAPAAHMDHSARSVATYNMNERPVSQPAGPPRPTTTIVQVCADVKPRLTKEQHEILERHFQAQPKPSTSVKKGFADALGVPLDKINNWFQNRRAKVKQDAKKQMNALQLFQATLAQHSQQYMAHPPQVSSALPHYFGPMPVVPSNTEPVNDSSAAPQTTMATQNANTMPTTTVPMPQDGTFVMHAPAMTSAPQGMAFEAQSFPVSMAEPPMMLQDFNFGSFSQEFNGLHENFDLFMQQPGLTPVSMDSMPNGPVFTPSDSSSPNTMPSLTSAYTHPSQTEDEKPQFHIDSPQEVIELVASNGHPTPADSTSAWSCTGHGSEQPESTPALAISYDSPASMDSFERRDSSVLTDSMSNVGIDNSSSDSDSSFRAASQTSGLAARRQKPRPANLMSTALRSASYSAGMPGSPGAGANAGPGAQDQLRRIRSHGITNGRIAKPPPPSKSPMHATFDAASIASPKFAQHASKYSVSTINSSGPLTATTMPGSLAPPTPITPNEFTRFPLGQLNGMYLPNGSPAYSHAGEDPIYLDTSSPLGKLDMQQMEQYRANMMARHEASLFNTPPQSAPAMQQHFGFTPPGMQPRQLMHVPHHMGHIRRPSLPDAPHGSHGVDSHAHFPSQMIMHAGNSMPPPFTSQPAEALPADAHAFAIAQTMPMHGDCVGDMSLQFMVPHPVKVTPDARLPVHFHNQTPEDFQDPARLK